MKKSITLFIVFFIVSNIIFGKDVLRGIVKFQYNNKNQLIKTQVFNRKKEQSEEIFYFYNKTNQIEKYLEKRGNRKSIILFKYNNNKIMSAENYFGLYKFYYKDEIIGYYDLISSYPEAGRYYIFSRKDKEKTIKKFSNSGYLTSTVDIYGNVNLKNPTYHIFSYSNEKTQIKKNKKGQVIEKIWGDKKNNEYHVKYFKYDRSGNLIEVKSINKVKVIASFFHGIAYLFAILLGGYSN